MNKSISNNILEATLYYSNFNLLQYFLRGSYVLFLFQLTIKQNHTMFLSASLSIKLKSLCGFILKLVFV